MNTRRDLLRGAAATAAAVPVLSARRLDAGVRTCARPVDAVLFDRRFSDSRAFARCLALQGAETLAVQDDVGRLWHDNLGGRFERGAARIAGLTLHSDLFISTEFARQHAARLVYQGVHDCRGCAVVTHTLESLDALVDAQPFQGRGRYHWAEELARRLTRWPSPVAAPPPTPIVARTPRASDHPGTLYSWVLDRTFETKLTETSRQ